MNNTDKDKLNYSIAKNKIEKSLNSNYQSKEDLISTERQLYNSINLNSRSLRANILFCSYILENITYANTLIKIDEKEIQKNKKLLDMNKKF